MKKLPFKPTALRRNAAAKATPAPDKDHDSDDDGLELFRRSKEMAPIVAADQERRMRRKRRQQEEEERKRAEREQMMQRRHFVVENEDEDRPFYSSQRSGAQSSFRSEESRLVEPDESVTIAEDSFNELVTPPPSKRSRHGSTSSRQRSTNISQQGSAQPSPSNRRKHSEQSLPLPLPSPAFKRNSATPSNAPVISLDSDSDENIKPDPSPSKPSRGPERSPDLYGYTPEPEITIASQQDAEPEEDEFAEYERKAAEQRDRDQRLLRSMSIEDSQSKETAQILVHSSIPGSQPLLVKFLFDKQLGLVRKTWAAQQRQKGVDIPDQDDDIVLTWRRQKVYNVATLLALGIRPQPDGRLGAVQPGRDGFDPARTKVQMEAWTMDSFQQMEHEQRMQRLRDAGEISDSDFAPEEPEETTIRVVLKALNFEDVQLSVHPGTTTETLVTAFRTQRDVSSDKDVSLWFDGEKLGEHVTMEEAEIDDMDTLEVHVK